MRELYTPEFVQKLDAEEADDFFSGDSHLPVTGEALELLADSGRPETAHLMACAASSSFTGGPELLWIAGWAEREHEPDVWRRAATNWNSPLELAGSAPAGEHTLHSLQGFIWKHTLATGRIWTSAEVGRMRRLAVGTELQGPPPVGSVSATASTAEVAQLVLEAESGGA